MNRGGCGRTSPQSQFKTPWSLRCDLTRGQEIESERKRSVSIPTHCPTTLNRHSNPFKSNDIDISTTGHIYHFDQSSVKLGYVKNSTTTSDEAVIVPSWVVARKTYRLILSSPAVSAANGSSRIDAAPLVFVMLTTHRDSTDELKMN